MKIRHSPHGATLFICIAMLLGLRAWAVINPSLQPDKWFNDYANVVVLEITGIAADDARLDCVVVKAIKGTLYPIKSKITITFTGVMAGQVKERQADGSFYKGYRFPVYAQKPSRRPRLRQLRMYADMFYIGDVRKKDAWTIRPEDGNEKDSEGKKVNTLAGIYCGMTGQLIKMLEDMAADRDFYPRKAYVKFKPDMLIDKLPKSVEALALYDINGDGMEDIVACSPAGDRVYFQLKPMQFTNVTEKVGLKTASTSCSLADVDCDGLTDILLDGTIFKGQFEDNQFSFAPTDWLKAGETGSLKSASFVELNGDGYPDVVMSVAKTGLRVFICGGKGIPSYTEKSEDFGVTQKTCGAGGNGYFMPGDWNGDGRTDLFYAHGDGYLLVQGKDGRFGSIAHKVEFSFKTGTDEYGKTGAGVFMPTLKPDIMDLMVPIEKDWLVIGNQAGKPVDISKWGNEISEGSDYHRATVAADLNVDGYVDIYTICDKQKENRYIINRGYGSYMHAKVHVDDKPLFKGPAHGGGGRALAVGDANDDGVPDVLLGNEKGQILLIINDTLSMRKQKPVMTKEEKRLFAVRLCSVRVLGPRGVINAKVRLLDSKGAVVGRYDLATNVATGCRGPDMVTVAVRQPGKYKVSVEYADGHKVDKAVDLSEKGRVSIVVERGEKEDGNAGW